MLFANLEPPQRQKAFGDLTSNPADAFNSTRTILAIKMLVFSLLIKQAPTPALLRRIEIETRKRGR